MGGGTVWLSGWGNVQGHFGFCTASTVYKSGVVAPVRPAQRLQHVVDARGVPKPVSIITVETIRVPNLKQLEQYLFLKGEKSQGIRLLKTDTLTVSAFNAFNHVNDESKYYTHRFVQMRYRFTQCISITPIITKF